MTKIGKLSMAVLLIVIAVFSANGVQAQVAFGVKPSTLVQSSYFGFVAGTSMVIQFGLDYARVNVSVKGDIDTEEVDQEVSASMMMPHGGIKMYLKPRGALTTSPYFMVDVFKAFSSVDLGEDEEMEDAEEFASDLISPWGLNVGFGAEYFFSDRFSIGGEYGFRYLMSSSEMDEVDMEISTNLGMTYAAISANFAF